MKKFEYYDEESFIGPEFIEFPDDMANSMELILSMFEQSTCEVTDSPHRNNRYPILYGPILVGKDKESLLINLNFGKTRADRELGTDLYRISIKKV